MSSDQSDKASGEVKESPKASSTDVIQLDEAQINAPSKHDLVMLAVICVATLILWAAGRAACNYSVPGEALTPRKVTLEDRTRMPKDVAIELAQVLSGGDFKTAALLVTGDAADFVKKDKQACGACEARTKERSMLMSVGTVLKANSVDTLVEVRTQGASSGPVTRLFGVERDGRVWRVSRVFDSAEDVVLKESPAPAPPPSLQRPEEGSEAESGSPAPPAAADDAAATGDAAAAEATTSDDQASAPTDD